MRLSSSAVSRKRAALYLSVGGLVAMGAAVSAVSTGDPDGVGLRAAMIVLAVGASLWLPWQALLPAALLIWLGPNYARVLVDNETLFSRHMLLELPGMMGLALFSGLARQALRRLEEENRLLGATSEEFNGADPDTGVYEERFLRPAIEAEVARARRFNRQLALVLVGVDELHQRFDYRDEADWASSFNATANLLRTTRTHIDRVYRYGAAGFALLLPESGERAVTGLIRRLRRVSRRAEPPEGDPGGPLPTHFGATFFPDCATTPDEMIRRAQVALRVAEKSSTRIQLDSAEAPDLPEPETLRRPDEGEAAAVEETSSDIIPAFPDHRVVFSEPVDDQRPRTPEPALIEPGPSLGDTSRSLFDSTIPEGDDAPAGEDQDTIEQALLTPRGFGVMQPAAASEPALSSEVQSPQSAGQGSHEATPDAALAVSGALSPAGLLDESFDDVLQRLDQTLKVIRSLRSRDAA